MSVLEPVSDFGSMLTLERLDRDLFRGRNASYGRRPTLFGGQVAGQCLVAAAATVETDRLPHSLHGYFLRPGRIDLPVILQVDRDRDGRSFSARRVVALQDGEVIFSMAASFHVEPDGPTFDEAPRRDAPAPEVTPPSGFPLIELREVTPTDYALGTYSDCMWLRSATPLNDDPVVHCAALTFLSDMGTGFGQLDSALFGQGGPSIDHAMWFHDMIRADDWVLLDLQPLKARAHRGMYYGSLRDRHGRLGATTAQEMLLLPGKLSDKESARESI